MSDTTYVAVYPRRFVNECVLYAAPAQRGEELLEFAHGRCPTTGLVEVVKPTMAAWILRSRPWFAFGYVPWEPAQRDLDDHYGHHPKQSPRWCSVCHPPAPRCLKDTVVAATVAEMGC